MIKVVVIDCAQGPQEAIAKLFLNRHDMQVVSTAQSCDEAVELIRRLRPTIAVVCHQPPMLDALDATQQIMQLCPLPIIILTARGSPGEVASTFDAVAAGALAVMPRPPRESGPGQNSAAKEFLQTVRVMSEVRVVRRWPKKHLEQVRPPHNPVSHSPGQLNMVAIGASTGGPLALAAILAGLPKDFAAPVMVVQHMAAGFIRGFVDWLAPSSALPVHIATHHERMSPGHVYMAPDGVHMEAARGNRIALVPGSPEHGVQPSVTSLFRSVAQLYGPEAAAVLLTGMGRDGAAELLLLRDRGAMTFAQDKASSVVHGMPGEAIKLGAAAHILTPQAIALALTKRSVAQREGLNHD
ncbi:chemotaxis protein CheB [Haliea sp. E1-2-M8]|uniref:chemotaxis protein CheB n=1 Tax=Haliea sp. E1-2-M8 TaxID=3064706 RepID=UPI00271D07F1|nr:chemotaxis protein CheB [Haliea sp. E1-2-M8]MDO8863572.1 chemotaxis protein CheB [Haliea sp. E1-2-M8]